MAPAKKHPLLKIWREPNGGQSYIYERVRRNEVERKFEELAESNGWKPTKRGWPDFLCFKDGQVIAVECKPRTKKSGELKLLKRDQVRTMEILISAGIKCYVSDGETLEKYNPKIHANESRRRSLSSKT